MTLRGRLSQFLLGLAFVAGCLFIFGSPTIPFSPVETETLAPARIQSFGGNSYYASLDLAHYATPIAITGIDSSLTPRGSNLQIFENGVKLGPPHSQHSDIAKAGGGRYSHWKNAGTSVVFSASDNSDPRINGRVYSVAVQPQIAPLLFVLALPLSAVLLQWLWSRWIGAAIFALAATALVAWVWLMFGHISMSPDSTSYIQWSPTYPLGYPLFISGIERLFGSLVWTSAVQVTLLVGACVFVALSVGRLTAHAAAALVTLVLLVCYVPMFSMAGFVLSEGLFVPLLLINVGAAIYLITEPRIRYAILLAATAALIMFVRPAGYFVPAGAIFLALAFGSRIRWMSTWVIAPMIVFFVATFLVNAAVRGSAAASQVGRVLFPHIAFLFEPDLITGPDKPYAVLLDKALEPHREKYRQAGNLSQRFIISMSDYNARLNDTDTALHEKFVAEGSGGQDAIADFRRADSLYFRLFLQTIYRKPLGYLLLIRDQVVGGWTLTVWQDYGLLAQSPSVMNDLHDAAAGYIKMLNLAVPEQALRPNTAALAAFPGYFVRLLDILSERLFPQKWLFYVVGVVTLLALPLSLFAARRSRYWLALGYCGAIIHGSILLTAATTILLPRYALPIDPVIAVAGTIMVSGMLSWMLATVRRLRERPMWAAVRQRIGQKPT